MKRLQDICLLARFASGISTPYYPYDLADLHARFAGLSLGPGDSIEVQRRDDVQGWQTVRRRTHAG